MPPGRAIFRASNKGLSEAAQPSPQLPCPACRTDTPCRSGLATGCAPTPWLLPPAGTALLPSHCRPGPGCCEDPSTRTINCATRPGPARPLPPQGVGGAARSPLPSGSRGAAGARRRPGPRSSHRGADTRARELPRRGHGPPPRASEGSYGRGGRFPRPASPQGAASASPPPS